MKVMPHFEKFRPYWGRLFLVHLQALIDLHLGSFLNLPS